MVPERIGNNGCYGIGIRDGRNKMTGEFAAAVHAIVFLNHKQQVLSSEALADNVCTHPARLRKILAKMKHAGLVDSQEGSDGGYFFTRDPATTTLRQIADALDIRLVCSSWRSGNTDMDCLIASGMADIMDNVYEQLDQECRSRLETITISDIDQKIFGNEMKACVK